MHTRDIAVCTARCGRCPWLAEARATAMAALLLAIAALAGCRGTGAVAADGGKATMELTSNSLRDGQVPKEFTCDGADRSPHLAWSGVPAGTKSFALIVSDPDAPVGTFVHWVLYDLPGTARELAEGLPKQAKLGDGSLQGQNDFSNTGYGGPCPPRGSTHRYFFELYALDGPLSLAPGASRAQVEKTMRGHVLARGELIARYGR